MPYSKTRQASRWRTAPCMPSSALISAPSAAARCRTNADPASCNEAASAVAVNACRSSAGTATPRRFNCQALPNAITNGTPIFSATLAPTSATLPEPITSVAPPAAASASGAQQRVSCCDS